MSVGALKKLLALANVVAILAFCGTAYGYWSHRQYLHSPHEWPDFAFTPAMISEEVGQMGSIGMTLGIYPKEVEKPAETPDEKPEEEILSVLEKLGTITDAIVAFPPYGGSDSVRPAIIFKLKEGSTIRTLALDEAIVNKPHPVYGDQFPIPVRYKFIGCRRDTSNPKVTLFEFDMHCDGKDIQSVPWKGETEKIVLEYGAALPPGQEGPFDVGKGFAVLSEKEKARQEAERVAKEAAEAKAREEAAASRKEPEKIEPAVVDPDQVLPTLDGGGVPDDFYEERDGTWMPTDEGSRYLEDNWKQIVEEARTSPYVNPQTGAREGILVRRIPSGSVAAKFGIYPDDVIQMVNGIAVRSKSEAINVVKNEIDVKKRRIIEVQILRNGKSIKKRYDTRDPETRRAARGLR